MKKYFYFINLEERGQFNADVRDGNDKTVYEIKVDGDDPDSTSIFEDGYMQHTHDISGLEKHLKQMKVIPQDATIVMGMEKGGTIRNREDFKKLVSAKRKIVEGKTPQQIVDLWNENSSAIKQGVSPPLTIADYTEQLRYYTGHLLVENELNEAEMDEFFEKGGVIKSQYAQGGKVKKPYDIGFASKGNGIVVYNRSKEVRGNYENIAHISVDGKIKLYKENLPEEIIDQIETEAAEIREGMDQYAEGGTITSSAKDYFASLNLAALSAPVQKYITSEVLTDAELEMLPGDDEDFIAIKNMIEKNFPEAVKQTNVDVKKIDIKEIGLAYDEGKEKFKTSNWEDTTKNFRNLASQYDDVYYSVTFNDNSTLYGSIDTGLKSFFEDKPNPVQWHLQTFWNNLSKHSVGGPYKQEDIDEAKNLVEKYNFDFAQPALPEPQTSSTPSKAILQTRLKIIKKMIAKDPGNAILKTRSKIVEKMIKNTKMAKGGTVVPKNHDGFLVKLVNDDGTIIDKPGFYDFGVGIRDEQDNYYPAGYDEAGNLFGGNIDSDDVILNTQGKRMENFKISSKKFECGGIMKKGGKVRRSNKRKRTGSTEIKKLCPESTEVVTLIFNKEKFANPQTVKQWAKENSFRSGNIGKNRNSFRARQRNPSKYKKDSFRTITLTDGVQAVVACPN